MTHEDMHTGLHPEAVPMPRTDWRILFATGILLIAGGVIAFLNPFLASLTAETIAAVAFGVSGAVHLWFALRRSHDVATRLSTGLLGLMLLGLAVLLVANPIAGLVSLTILVAASFAALGVLRLVMAWQAAEGEGRGWHAASGVVSIVLALLIAFALPVSALGTLGLLLGVELVASGAATCAVALARRAG